jgi:hypothetical protein
MAEPEPADAPVMVPVMVPIVQLYKEGVLDVKTRLVFAPEQILNKPLFIITGMGFTVTTIENGIPEHEPEVDTGVTMYSTVPGVAFPGLVNTWLILFPLPAEAPVIPPVLAPVIHEYEEGIFEVRLIPVEVPLQICIIAWQVITGLGFTVMSIIAETPLQPWELTGTMV